MAGEGNASEAGSDGAAGRGSPADGGGSTAKPGGSSSAAGAGKLSDEARRRGILDHIKRAAHLASKRSWLIHMKGDASKS